MKRNFVVRGFQFDGPSHEPIDVKLVVGDHGWRLDFGDDEPIWIVPELSGWTLFTNSERSQIIVIRFARGGLKTLRDVVLLSGFLVLGCERPEEDEGLITTVVLARVHKRQRRKTAQVLLRESQGWIYDLTTTTGKPLTVNVRRRLEATHQLISDDATFGDAPIALVKTHGKWSLDVNGILSVPMYAGPAGKIDESSIDPEDELVVYNCAEQSPSGVNSFRSTKELSIIGFGCLEEGIPAYVVCTVGSAGGTLSYNTTHRQSITVTRKNGHDSVVLRRIRKEPR